MLDVFKALKAQLKAHVTGLATDPDRWNGQLDNEATERVLTFPAVFYQLDGVKLTTISRGVQHGEGILRVRHANRALRPGGPDAYQVEAQTYLALQNFQGGPILTGLDRIALYPDPTHAALEVIISEYRLKYSDATKLTSQTVLVPAEDIPVAATVEFVE